MATRVSQTPLIIQDENLSVHLKKAGNNQNPKTAIKKAGVGLGNRKALNDITNKKPAIRPEASSKKKNVQKQEFNVAEEMFLHDHNKCVQEKRSALNAFSLDWVLPGHDSVSTAKHREIKQVKMDRDEPYPFAETEELPMSEFSGWFQSATQGDSHPSSPISWDSPPSSPFASRFEAVEYVLKEGDDLLL